MQPEGPYRFTEAFGVCAVGTAWWAVDGQDRLVTVAVLEGAAAADPPWRQAFADAARAMAQAPGGQRYVNADLAAAHPWVAYPSEDGIGAQRLFQTLGMDLHPAESYADVLIPVTETVAELPKPVSGTPLSVSGPPNPTSGPPHLPWAMHAPVIPQQQVPSVVPPSSAPTQPVSAPPRPVSAPPQPDQAAPPRDPFAPPARRIQPSPPPRRQTGLWAALAALLLVAVVSGGVGVWARSGADSGAPTPAPTAASTAFPTATPVSPGLKPWAQAALRSPEERALATAGPSMVFVEVIFTGYVRNKQDNALLRRTPITFNRRCSGLVVNQDGHVLTNSQCVRPTQDILLGNALNALGNALVAEGNLTAKGVAAFAKARMKTAVFTGTAPGSDPESKLYGQLNVAKGDVTDSPAIPGTVVQALALDAGNLALVKLDQGRLPAAELNASATVAPDTALLILGYTTTDTSYRSASYSVLSKAVTVTGVDTQSPVNAYRINEDLGLYSRGGIAIDPSGRVVGMLDNDILRPDKANRVVVPVSTMVGLLSTAGVQNSLGESDKLYRSGLEAYFAGHNSTAVARFADVVEDSPSNLLAQAYRQAAADSGGGAGSSDSPGWAAPLLGAAGGALAVGMVVLVVILVRRRADQA